MGESRHQGLWGGRGKCETPPPSCCISPHPSYCASRLEKKRWYIKSTNYSTKWIQTRREINEFGMVFIVISTQERSVTQSHSTWSVFWRISLTKKNKHPAREWCLIRSLDLHDLHIVEMNIGCVSSKVKAWSSTRHAVLTEDVLRWR